MTALKVVQPAQVLRARTARPHLGSSLEQRYQQHPGRAVLRMGIDVSELLDANLHSRLRGLARSYVRKNPGSLERVMVDCSSLTGLLRVLDTVLGPLYPSLTLKEADYVAIGSSANLPRGVADDQSVAVWVCLESPGIALHLPDLDIGLSFEQGTVLAFSAEQPHAFGHPGMLSFNPGLMRAGEVIEALCLVFRATHHRDMVLGATPALNGYSELAEPLVA